MKRKDFYIGLLVITISPHRYASFRAYLSQDTIISLSFYTEAVALASIIIYLIVREMYAMIKYDPDKK